VELNILALVGSPRLGGNTDFLVDQALEEAAKLGAQTEKIVLSQYKVAPCLGHDDCGTFKSCTQEDDTSWILGRLCEVDGVILATPVYYYNITAQLKAFIDRSYFLYMHGKKSKAKVVGIVVVAESAGIDDTVHTLRHYINEAFKVPEDAILELRGYAFRLGEAKTNSHLIRQAKELGRKMAKSLA
jgi:multimeric flavodoxin WrbA